MSSNNNLEAVLLLDNFHGIHQPAIFCGRYASELEEQGFGNAVCDVLRAEDNILDPDAQQAGAEAWDEIVDGFIPEPGYHLGYLPDDQALFAIPDGMADEEEE